MSIDFQDLDIEAGRVAILGKGRTRKVSLTLPAETKAALSDWLQIRGTDPGPESVARKKELPLFRWEELI